MFVQLEAAAGLGDSSSFWASVTKTLGSAVRESDLMGWVETERTIGLILSDIGGDEALVARMLAARVQDALIKEAGLQVADALCVRFYRRPRLANADGLNAAPFAALPEKLQSGTKDSQVQNALKRALDIIGGVALLLMLSPLLLLAAALVKLTSRGPVFFKQVRIGQMGRPFTMLKFRTMHENADHALHRRFVTEFIQSSNEGQKAANDGFFKIIHDPRVTPLGGILRKTSIDELPQLWNVVRGDMSLVGPRPPLAYEVEQYRSWHWRRILEAKPGVTGLWQVTGRSRTTFDEMVRLDLRYVKQRSLWTDLKILLATPAAVIAGKGAC
jgi:lipopolysaccharide/colanic/teichoic acid biosynthesis glycosyltransferase